MRIVAMADLHALFVSALALSLAFCAHPGAVTTEAFRRGLRGSRPVLFCELGALAAAPPGQRSASPAHRHSASWGWFACS